MQASERRMQRFQSFPSCHCGRRIAGRPGADAGEQESLLAERRGLGNDLAEKTADSTWPGKATRRGFANATVSMRTDFLVGTGLTRPKRTIFMPDSGALAA